MSTADPPATPRHWWTRPFAFVTRWWRRWWVQFLGGIAALGLVVGFVGWSVIPVDRLADSCTTGGIPTNDAGSPRPADSAAPPTTAASGGVPSATTTPVATDAASAGGEQSASPTSDALTIVFGRRIGALGISRFLAWSDGENDPTPTAALTGPLQRSDGTLTAMLPSAAVTVGIEPLTDVGAYVLHVCVDRPSSVSPGTYNGTVLVRTRATSSTEPRVGASTSSGSAAGSDQKLVLPVTVKLARSDVLGPVIAFWLAMVVGLAYSVFAMATDVDTTLNRATFKGSVAGTFTSAGMVSIAAGLVAAFGVVQTRYLDSATWGGDGSAGLMALFVWVLGAHVSASSPVRAIARFAALKGGGPNGQPGDDH